MNFVRPEVTALALRWRWVLLAGALAAFGLVALNSGIQRADLLRQGLGVMLGLAGAAGIVATFNRARLSMQITAPGVVEVTERRIMYLGPEFGGTMDIEAIQRLDLRHTPTLGRAWGMTDTSGSFLMVPTDAEGAEALLDAFLALPGVRESRLVGAISAFDGNRRVIWQRDSA